MFVDLLFNNLKIPNKSLNKSTLLQNQDLNDYPLPYLFSVTCDIILPLTIIPLLYICHTLFR